VTFFGVVPGDFLEITPISNVLLHLPMTLLFLWLGMVFGMMMFVRAVFIILWFLQTYTPKILFFMVLKLLLDFNNISISRTE
jgi:hypothetical protein